MIFAASGEIQFDDGLRIIAHAPVGSVLRANPGPVESRTLAARGWNQHLLGEHRSSFGIFQVEVTSGPECRVAGVLLSHVQAFDDSPTRDDVERRELHEHVIAADLCGQREFSWGHVFCRREEEAIRDWLVVIYSPFTAVGRSDRTVPRVLAARRKPFLDGPGHFVW